MADYKTYLASAILTEDKVITYRLLSRALKVNVNVAKEMLFEFHQQQNSRKPGTIHATYLISGTKREEPIPSIEEPKKDGEDSYMQSSPFVGSSMPQMEESTGESGVLSIILVREENLEETQLQYEHISSIHVYSIGSHPLKDLQKLSDITREMQVLCAEEDALEYASRYGTIINKNAKRRTGKRPPPPAADPPVKTESAKPKAVEKEPAKKQEPKPSQPSSAKDFFGKGKEKTKAAEKAKPAAASNSSSKESTPNPPTLKRDSSSIFKSFAKAKPKLKREETDSSAVDSPVISAAEDSPMKDVSDDDEEETYVPPPPAKKEIVDSDRKARKDREAALRKMMEQSDDEDEVVTPAAKEVEVESKEPSIEPEDEPSEEPPVVSGGRRRGRRRVMKKKTVKDAEGYLVTKEEPVWESFSEDEPAPKPRPKISVASSATTKKKGAAKAGQGNIMSFFGKK